MEQKDSAQKPDVPKEGEQAPPAEAPTAPPADGVTENAPAEEAKEEKKKASKKNYVFKECPETSTYTAEELETENSKTLDPIEVTTKYRPRNSYGKRVRVSAFFLFRRRLR